MAKRFTATEIWGEDWFLDMPNNYKLFWYYMLSHCDHAGLFRVNLNIFCKLSESKVSPSEIIAYFNTGKDRIRVISPTVWFIEDFFVFQYGNIFNHNNKLHESIYKLYNKYNINILQLRGLKEVKEKTKRGDAVDFDTLKDKVKVKDKDILEITDIVKESSKDEIMLIVEMMKIWDMEMPGYVHEKTTDYHACLNIAYKIAESEGWMKADVVEGKKIELLSKWSAYAKFISTHKWFSGLTLDSLAASKIWQKVSNDFKNMPATGLKMPLVKGLDEARQEYLKKMSQK